MNELLDAVETYWRDAMLGVMAAMLFIVSLPSDAATPIPQAGWTLHSVSSEELVAENSPATNAFDGNPATKWHSSYSAAGHPHSIAINLGSVYSISGISYLPRQNAGGLGTILDYRFDASMDGTTWIPVSSGAFTADLAEKLINFTAIAAQYVRLTALSEIQGQSMATVAELNVLGDAVVDPPAGYGDVTLDLKWTPNTDQITGYYVFYGDSPATADQQIATVPQSAYPSHTMIARADLLLADGYHSVCYRLMAYHDTGTATEKSALSDSICTSFTLTSGGTITPSGLTITLTPIP